MTRGTQVLCRIEVYPTLVRVTTKTRRPGQVGDTDWSEQVSFDVKTALDELPGLKSDVRRYGQRLFEMLFPPGSKTLSVFHGIDPQADVRVIVEIEDDIELGSDLCNLRWEYLCAEDKPNDILLARSTRFRLARRLNSLRSSWTERSPLEGLPRVLVVLANPTDLQAHNFEPVERLVNPVQTRGLLELFGDLKEKASIADYKLLRAPFLPGQEEKGHEDCIEEYPTPDRIHDVLRNHGSFHIVHFLAHGRLDDKGKGYILLEDADGKANPVHQNELDSLFPRDHQVRLVVFATCHSGEQMINQPLAGLAPSVLQVGVPAVIAMQDEISKRAAASFSRTFYRELEKGIVDTAVVDARREVHRNYPETEEWAIPVLYLQNNDPRLFESKLPEPAEHAASDQRLQRALRDRIEKEIQAQKPIGPGVLIEQKLKPRKDLLAYPRDRGKQIREWPITKIGKVFEETAYGKLLIVGTKGSGKETLLYRLAGELLTNGRDGDSLVPVRLTLQTWRHGQIDESIGEKVDEWLAEEFVDFLADQLSVEYNDLAPELREWVTNQRGNLRLCLLLDDLEQLNPARRETCVRSINSFIKKKGVGGIVVFSEVGACEALGAHFDFPYAVQLQTLEAEQVAAYLEDLTKQATYSEDQCNALAALRTELQRDEKRTQEYAGSPEDLIQLIDVYLALLLDARHDFDKLYDEIEIRRNELCPEQVARQFTERPDGDASFSPVQTRRWLTWLAQRMKRYNEIPFYTDQIQPDWLSTSGQKHCYTFLAAMAAVLLVGFAGWLLIYCQVDVFWYNPESVRSYYAWRAGPLVGVVSGLYAWFAVHRLFRRVFVVVIILLLWVAIGVALKPAFGKFIGAGVGLAIALVLGLALYLYGRGHEDVQPGRIESVGSKKTWSWARAMLGIGVGAASGFFVWLFLDVGYWSGQRGWPFGTVLRHVFNFQTALWLGLGRGMIPGFGLLGMLIFGGRMGTKIDPEKRVSANQGIQRSRTSALRFGGLGTLSVGIPLAVALLLFDRVHGRTTLASLTSSDAVFGWAMALLAGSLAGLILGGYAFIQHWVLRFMLWKGSDFIQPWKYDDFLIHAVDLGFLKRRGRGYEFPDKWWGCFKAFKLDEAWS